jgi:site-specific DNA-cytosine methylase
MSISSIEICAGAGGQALGLEQAGFDHVSLIEIEAPACQTLRMNRPNWQVVEGDLRHYSTDKWKGVALLAGGVPCPPFSKAGKQAGSLVGRRTCAATAEKSVHFGVTASANSKCYWLVSATELSSIFASLACTPSADQTPRQ